MMKRGVKSVLPNFCRRCLGVIKCEAHATHGRMVSSSIVKLCMETTSWYRVGCNGG